MTAGSPLLSCLNVKKKKIIHYFLRISTSIPLHLLKSTAILSGCDFPRRLQTTTTTRDGCCGTGDCVCYHCCCRHRLSAGHVLTTTNPAWLLTTCLLGAPATGLSPRGCHASRRKLTVSCTNDCAVLFATKRQCCARSGLIYTLCFQLFAIISVLFSTN